MSLILNALATAVLLGIFFFSIAKVSLRTAQRVWLPLYAVIFGSAVTMMVAHSFVAKWGFRGDSPSCGLTHLMDGTAERPFVYRRLAPAVVRMTTNLALPSLPPPALDYLQHRSPLGKYRAIYEGEFVTWTERTALAFHIAYVLTWLALFGTLLAGAALNRTLRGCSWLEAITTACLVMCLVPLMFTAGGYVYDPPELLLWTTALLAAVAGRFWLVPPVFALMLLNKESALLAVPALFPIFYRRSGLARATIWTALLGVMGCAWSWFVHARFAGQPGQPMAWYLWTNLAFWLKPDSYFRLGQLFSPSLPSPRGANIAILLLLCIPLRFGWRSVRVDIQRASIVLAAVLVPIYLTSGYIDEVRALSLLYPFLLIGAVEGVATMFGQRSAALDRSSARSRLP